MPRPLPPGGQPRRAVPLRLTEAEERPARELADAEYGGNLSEAIRRIIAEWPFATPRTMPVDERLRSVVAAAREVAEVADRMGDDFDRDTIALHILRDRIADLDRETS